MNKLNIALIQANLFWEDSYANLKMFDEYLHEMEGVDLVVLPEMFNTGFSMEPEKVAQGEKGQAVSWLKKKSTENNFAIIGSAATQQDNKYYNRLMMSYPCSRVKHYDKRHLFRMGGEHEKYAAGTQNKVWSYYGWRLKPLVCYDLRFPVWSRNKNDYDLLIYVANWPASRADVWKTLLKARAIENQCYVVGVNRVGEDGRGIKYQGDSMVVGPKGNVIENLNDKPGAIKTSIDLSELIIFREQFPVHLDADTFQIYS